MTRLQAYLETIAARLGIDPPVALVLAALIVALMLGTAARGVAWLALHRERDRKLLWRIAGWWLLTVVFIAVVVLPSPAATVFVTIISLAALHEYWRLLPAPLRDDRLVPWLYLGVPAHYLALWRWGEPALLFVLPAVLGVVAGRLVVADMTEGFTRRFAAAALGWVLMVWAISFVALFDGPHGATGWFVFYLVLTEGNDIAAAWFGRRFGRSPITPRVSPKKTWTGTVGGIATTVALALVLAPLLTPWPPAWAIVAGLLIGVAGFFSDVMVSAIKRDAGVKDAGELLPEQGGVLDRADSAILTAPLFYALVRLSGAGA